MLLIYTANLIKRFRASDGVFHDSAGTVPASVGDTVGRWNSMVDNAPISYVRTNGAPVVGERDGKRFITGGPGASPDPIYTPDFCLYGGPLDNNESVIPPNFTIVFVFRFNDAPQEVNYFSTVASNDWRFGGRIPGVIKTTSQGDVNGEGGPELPLNALQVVTISRANGGNIVTRVNGTLTYSRTAADYHVYWLQFVLANSELYETLFYAEAESTALLNGLRDYVQGYYGIQPTLEDFGNSHFAPNGPGASQPNQSAMARVEATCRILLAAAPVPADLIFVNRAVGGQATPTTKTAVTGAVALHSAMLGPSALLCTEVTNDAILGNATTANDYADRFLAIGPVARGLGVTKAIGVTPPYYDYLPDFYDALIARLQANQSAGANAFDAIIHPLNPARLIRWIYDGIHNAILPDGIHQCNNEHSIVATTLTPATIATLSSYMTSAQIAVVAAKKPTIASVVVASDRLSCDVLYDMPIEVRNPAAIGRKQNGDSFSQVMTDADFANEQRYNPNGNTPNPLTRPDEYKQATGYTLTGAGAAGITITQAVTPPEYIDRVRLSFSQALPVPGTQGVDLSDSGAGNVKNHLGNKAVASTTILVSGPVAPPLTALTVSIGAAGSDGKRQASATPTPSGASMAGGVWGQTGGGSITVGGLSTPPAQTSSAQTVTVTFTVGSIVGTATYTVPALSPQPGGGGLTEAEAAIVAALGSMMEQINGAWRFKQFALSALYPPFDPAQIADWTITADPKTQAYNASTETQTIVARAETLGGHFLTPSEIAAAGLEIAFIAGTVPPTSEQINAATFHPLQIVLPGLENTRAKAVIRVGVGGAVTDLSANTYQRVVRVIAMPTVYRVVSPFILQG